MASPLRTPAPGGSLVCAIEDRNTGLDGTCVGGDPDPPL